MSISNIKMHSRNEKIYSNEKVNLKLRNLLGDLDLAYG